VQRVLDAVGVVERRRAKRGVQRAVAGARAMHLEAGARGGFDRFGRQQMISSYADVLAVLARRAMTVNLAGGTYAIPGSSLMRMHRRLAMVLYPAVRLQDGTVHTAEIHWYEAHGIGRQRRRLWLLGRSFRHDRTTHEEPGSCDGVCEVAPA
jgi:hypothetical protein